MLAGIQPPPPSPPGPPCSGYPQRNAGKQKKIDFYGSGIFFISNAPMITASGDKTFDLKPFQVSVQVKFFNRSMLTRQNLDASGVCFVKNPNLLSDMQKMIKSCLLAGEYWT